jgi:hypothetical protein
VAELMEEPLLPVCRMEAEEEEEALL